MHTRSWVRRLCVLALFGLAVLIARPIAVEVLQVRPDPQQIRVVGSVGTSQHCIIVADCDAVTTAGTAIDISHAGMAPSLTGIIVVAGFDVTPTYEAWSSSYLAPPPRTIAL